MSAHHTGGCLCGAVRYRVLGVLRGVVLCHCEQCRRTSGHHVAATQAAAGELRMERDDGLRWYRSSEAAERGFCAQCGASLFWRRMDSDRISIMAGTLDMPSGLATVAQIHTEAQADYHRLDPSVPVVEQADLAAFLAGLADGEGVPPG